MSIAKGLLIVCGASLVVAIAHADRATPRTSDTVVTMQSNLAESLQAAGFYSGLDSGTAARLEAAVRRDGYAAVFTHPWRALRADDETIAEGDVAKMLESWAPAFRALGIAPLAARTAVTDTGDYVLRAGNRAIVLVRAAEQADDAAGRKPGYAWGLAGARLIAEANRHLAANGRAERLYSYLGGNDHHVLVLTPAMFDVLAKHPSIPARERPYVRTEQWPGFGMSP